jgi:BirA family transcriptional regulator, biotin operon repressor / biotin---[acetyl-CoA-carboxylase] ligase
MPLRLDALPRHDARAEALSASTSSPMSLSPQPLSTVLDWHEEALRARLDGMLHGIHVEVLKSTASTNSALLERARVLPEARKAGNEVLVHRSVESGAFGRRAADLEPCLLVAEQQTSGRGRQGRNWKSAAGASLTFSLGLAMRPRDWSGLSLAVGVALCEALDAGDAAALQPERPRLGLKWPNDLWLVDRGGAGRKLGGILIETVAAGPERLVVVGVGLNVRPFEATETGSGFASLDELDPSTSAPGALAQIALPLVEVLQTFEREGYAPFAARFAARDVLLGRALQTTLAAVPAGIGRGVTASGALRVETPDGHIVEVASGEVSVRFGGPATAGGSPRC